MALSTVFLKVMFVLALESKLTNSQSSTTCSETTTCSARGVCVVPVPSDTSASLCVCDNGYTTHPMPATNTASDVVYCNYQQRQQLTAFLLSFFVGWTGADRFYVGDWIVAVFKLLYCTLITCCLVWCLLPCTIYMASNRYEPVSTEAAEDAIVQRILRNVVMLRNTVAMGAIQCCCLFLWALGCIVWCLTDVILFGLNDVKDGNGVQLASWLDL
eukprot:CAMPEP_0197036012 /NCGR_PEP_ID=MMETSP1384-20130603/13639_1 /TAXON_ID=29189 /ORGANISM="Ammonia sp." /LENGTH=214 /DNA_ID=CAMNT_0042466137 /DNA_START=44 /DNA_END=688 /DNA_ORIENTATION=+